MNVLGCLAIYLHCNMPELVSARIVRGSYKRLLYREWNLAIGEATKTAREFCRANNGVFDESRIEAIWTPQAIGIDLRGDKIM